MIRKSVLSFFLVVSALTGKSQDFYEPKLSFSVDMGIPAKGHNLAFSKVMEGLFNGGAALQYNIVGGLSVGAGVKYSFFTLNPFALNNVQWNGTMHFPAGFIKIGYEKFTTNRSSLNASVRMGVSSIFAIHGNDSGKVNYTYPNFETAFFIEPQLELVLLTEKSSSNGFSLVLGYPFYFNEFGPRYLSMDKFPGQYPEDSEGITRFFSFGFGYRYYFGRK